MVGRMRASGVVDSAHGLGSCSHVCWAYSDRADFRLRVAEFVADGLEAGELVEYVGGGSAAALRAELEQMPIDSSAMSSGRLRVHTTSDFFRFDRVSGMVDSQASISGLPTAVSAAVAGGYTGLRLVTDATTMACSPRQRAALAELEWCLDQACAGLPISALCLYETAALGKVGIAEIACLHPIVKRGSTAFRLYIEHGHEFTLAGELDLANRDLFAANIDRMTTHSEGRIVIHIGGVTFMGHQSLIAVDQAAAAARTTIELYSAGRSIRRLADLLELGHIRLHEGDATAAA